MIDQTEFEDPNKSKESTEINKPPKPLEESTLEIKQFEISSTNSVAPFLNRLRSNKYSAHMDQILEIFKQMKVNIPLLDMIQQVSTYAKFLKDPCTKKKTTNVFKKAFLAASVSSYLSSYVPVKYKDLRSPTISCVIGKTIIDRALLDLGTSVNILPYSVYKKLGIGELKPT